MVEHDALVLAVRQRERAERLHLVVELVRDQPRGVAPAEKLAARRDTVRETVHAVGSPAAVVKLPALGLRVPAARERLLNLPRVGELLVHRLGVRARDVFRVHNRERAASRGREVHPWIGTAHGQPLVEALRLRRFIAPALPAVVDEYLEVHPEAHPAVDPEVARGDGVLLADALQFGLRHRRRQRGGVVGVLVRRGDIDHIRRQQHLHGQADDGLVALRGEGRDGVLASPRRACAPASLLQRRLQGRVINAVVVSLAGLQSRDAQAMIGALAWFALHDAHARALPQVCTLAFGTPCGHRQVALADLHARLGRRARVVLQHHIVSPNLHHGAHRVIERLRIALMRAVAQSMPQNAHR
jgi:hypothetical protein